jgi:predicted Rossmann fold nucleotide-binding protein DprA/Smf involved in DNA uptake
VIDRDELAAWLRLVGTPGIGRDAARRLLAEFGSPEAVLAASTGARKALVGSEVAMAACLMVVAVLVGRSLMALERIVKPWILAWTRLGKTHDLSPC